MPKQYIFLFSIMLLGLLALGGFYASGLLGASLYFLKYFLVCIILLAVAAYALLFSSLRRGDRLQESKSRYQKLLALAPEAVMVCEGECISYANRQALVLLGAQSLDQVVGKHAAELIQLGNMSTFMKQKSQLFQHACQLEKLDGTVIDVEISVNLFLDEGQETFLVYVHDISERKRLEKEIFELEERTESLLEFIDERFYSVNEQWEVVYHNLPDTEDAERTGEELYGKNIWEEYPYLVGTNIHHQCKRAMAERIKIEFEEYCQPLDRWLLIRIYPTKKGLSIFYRNITEQKRNELEAQKVKEKYEIVVNTIHEAVFHTDRRGRLTFLNPYWEVMLGYTVEESLGKSLLHYMHPDDRERNLELFRSFLRADEQYCCYEIRCISKEGAVCLVELFATLILDGDGNITGASGTLRDITEQKQTEQRLIEVNERLQILANVDGLTGIGNRRYFDEMLDKEWKRAIREKQPLSVILFDVDQFKLYNDYYGHQMGDECLKEVSGALVASLYRPSDIGARYGGEEFVILLPNTDYDGALQVAERTRRAIENLGIQHERSNVSHVVTSSFGVASMLPTMLSDASELVAAADKALYQAKRAGRNRVAFYSMEPEKKTDAGEHEEGNATELLPTIEGYLSSLHAYDEITWEHSNRIAYYAIHLAQELGLSLEERDHVYMAALLHDIGKMSIPKSILNKPGCLTKEEFEVIQQHPLLGYEKLIRHDILKEKPQILMGVLHHHERWDGNGYPYRLKGEEIPLLARILAVVDAFDAMTSDRVYRKVFSIEEALEEIKQNIGVQFDPQIAELFIRICLSYEEMFQSMGKSQAVNT